MLDVIMIKILRVLWTIVMLPLTLIVVLTALEGHLLVALGLAIGLLLLSKMIYGNFIYEAQLRWREKQIQEEIEVDIHMNRLLKRGYVRKDIHKKAKQAIEARR